MTTQTRTELLMGSRFTLIGLGATCVHMGITWTLIKVLVIPPLIANLVAFLAAFFISFTGHYFWTFRSKRNHTDALWRFFLVAAAAFAANNLVLVKTLDSGRLAPEWAGVFAALVIPVFTYLLSRLWALR